MIKDRLLVLRNIFSTIPKLRGKLDPEDEICYEFAERVRYLQLEDMCRKEFVWTHIANEFAGKSRPVFGMKLKAVGKVTGWPDYVFMSDDVGLAIEFKDKGGSQSDSQRKVQKWFELSGVDYHVARSADEGVKILVDAGLI